MQKIRAISKSAQRLSYAGLIIGALILIMHWPGGRDVVRFFQVLFFLSSIGCLLTATPKSYGHWAGILGLIAYALYMLNIQSILFADTYLLGMTALCGFTWYWDVGMEENIENGIAPFFALSAIKGATLYLAGVLFVITGSLFKIMHWPYADMLLIVGMVAIAIQLILGIFNKESKD